MTRSEVQKRLLDLDEEEQVLRRGLLAANEFGLDPLNHVQRAAVETRRARLAAIQKERGMLVPEEPAGDTAGLAAVVLVQRSRVVAGNPLTLQVKVENLTEHPVSLVSLQVHVTPPAGAQVPPSTDYSPEKRIEPGGELYVPVTVAWIHPLWGSPRVHQVGATLRFSSSSVVEAEPADITVHPPM